jgi:signal transduction histidine kinase
LNPNDEVVISRPSVRILDYLISFSYLFVFLYILWFVINLAIHFPKGPRLPVLVLKQRIQLTIIAVLMISLMVIGGGITYYVIRQYQQSNLKLIEEKSKTLLTDLQYKLGMEPELKPDWRDDSYRNLEELLLKFSYVFNTDINLYDPEGRLLASSRPEVYEFNLIGRWMNPLAFTNLHHYGKSSYIHKESIESLGFISSYLPVFNQNNHLIAYLNLPFFSKQSQIRDEISAILVATLNAYFILILLSIFLAVLLANQVTRPLHLLQSKLAGLKLGGRNQGIEYHRQDEIGQLVEEYNRMVSELQASADKLARSERESAWREMARQIAHEIKNPLTPMKLSVQHLRKAWKDNAPDLDKHIDKVTRTLIEQIDTLSAIATEFSKFAKMPGAHFEQIDLVSKLKSISQLFEESCRISFETAPGTPDEVIVYADKEQILQVFNNLIRNAIQAVPEGSEPVVGIELESGAGSALIRVNDNGAGIPEELQPKMFEPNFTTKSSGMGLGLAISKKYIEGSGGDIWFETEKGKGTTFFIRLPLAVNE